jgi:hypothetical protein
VTRKLGQFLNSNSAALVSIPAHFEDTKCRSYKFAAIELFLLWLEGDDFPTRLPPEDKRYSASAASVEGEVGRIVRLLATTSWKSEGTAISDYRQPIKGDIPRATPPKPEKTQKVGRDRGQTQRIEVVSRARV